jgi:cupin fold WbuC family metalloprotein
MSDYQLFDFAQWQALKGKAEVSTRLRAHFNLHQSYQESIQKTAICLLNDTYIPPHYHRHAHQKELFILLAGQVKVVFFNQDGSVTKTELLETGGMIEISANTIHTVFCMSEFAQVLEVKQGPFIANDCKEFLDWTIPENHQNSDDYIKWLKNAKVGEKFG